MFEGIPFIELPERQLTSENRLPDGLSKESSLFPMLTASDIRALTAPAAEGSFHLSGRRSLMAPLPITTTAWERLLYLESFSLAESDADYFTRRRGSETYLLSYTYSGEGLLTYKGNEYTLQEGDGFWIDCRIPHAYHTQGRLWKHGDLHFNGYMAAEFYSVFSQGGPVIFHSRSTFQQQLEHLLRSYQTIQPGRDLMIHAALSGLLSGLLEKQHVESPSGMEETIHRLIQYIQVHFPEPIHMDDLSALCSVSKYHLSREFRRLTGYAPIEYLLMVRMENAGSLLRTTDLPIPLIALRCGIDSEQYFSRLFRKHYGISPGRYRRQV